MLSQLLKILIELSGVKNAPGKAEHRRKTIGRQAKTSGTLICPYKARLQLADQQIVRPLVRKITLPMISLLFPYPHKADPAPTVDVYSDGGEMSRKINKYGYWMDCGQKI